MKSHIRFDAGAMLLLGVICFTLKWNEIAALLTAAAVHELGHLISLVISGYPPNELIFTISGPVLNYPEPNSCGITMIAALAGPAAGLLLAVILRRSWPLCAEMSFLLSVSNLLPVLPLDGGRMLLAMGTPKIHRLLSVLGVSVPLLILLLGLALTIQGQNGFGILMFGAWLMLLSCQESQFDVK